MKGTKKVLSILLAVLLVFQVCLPVMAKAEEINDDAAEIAMPERIATARGASTSYFKYDDHYYYDLGIDVDKVKSASDNYEKFVNSQAYFAGYETENSMGQSVMVHWADIALMLLRNNDLLPTMMPGQVNTGTTCADNSGNNLADAESNTIKYFDSWGLTARALQNDKSGGPTYAYVATAHQDKDWKPGVIESTDDNGRIAPDATAPDATSPSDTGESKALTDMTAPADNGQQADDQNQERIDVTDQEDTQDPAGKIDSGYHGYGVYIYNIKATPVINDSYIEWAKANKKMTTSNNTKANETIGVSMANNTPTKVSGSQTTSTSINESVTKTQNGSDTYSFTEGMKVSVKASMAKIAEITGEISLSATQSFSSGWSNSKSHSVTKNSSINQNVDIPGYTAVKTRQSFQNGSFGIDSDIPMTFTYDVKIVDYGTTDKPYAKVLATYEASKSRGSTDAQTDLYQRAFKGQENEGLHYLTAADGINKEGFNCTNIINRVTCFSPYITMKDTTYAGKIDDKALMTDNFISLHPLKKVDTLQDKRETTIKPGASLYLRDIGLAGYLDTQYTDGQGGTAKYATFNRDRGHWEIESGKGVIEINTDSQKQQTLKGLKEGEATIKYVIDEDVYDSAEKMKDFTKNSDLKSTAVFKIKVSKNAKAELMADDFEVKIATQGKDDKLSWQKDAGQDGAILGAADDKAQALYGLEFNADHLKVQLDTINTEGETMSTEAGSKVKTESKAPIEAFRIKQTAVTDGAGELTYRAYVQGKGWTDWDKEGEFTGSHGFKAPITALQVQMVGVAERLDKPADAMDTAYLVADGYGLVNYNAGGDSVSDGAILGDPNGDSCLQDINVSADPARSGMDISVSDTTHTEAGDLDSFTLTDKSQGAKGKLYYRAYTDDTGWMDWAESGNPAGSQDLDQGIKAVQIVYSEDGERPNSANYPVDYTASYEKPMNFVGHIIHTVRMNRAANAALAEQEQQDQQEQ